MKHFQARPRNKKYFSLKHLTIAVTAICVESCSQVWPSNKNLCGALSFTDNIHWVMFFFQAQSQNKKYFSFMLTITAVKTLCWSMFSSQTVKQKYLSCNICRVIFVVGNIDGWLHHNKIFSFKTKNSIIARREYIKSLKIPSAIGSKNYFVSVGRLLKSQNIYF